MLRGGGCLGLGLAAMGTAGEGIVILACVKIDLLPKSKNIIRRF